MEPRGAYRPGSPHYQSIPFPAEVTEYEVDKAAKAALKLLESLPIQRLEVLRAEWIIETTNQNPKNPRDEVLGELIESCIRLKQKPLKDPEFQEEIARIANYFKLDQPGRALAAANACPSDRPHKMILLTSAILAYLFIDPFFASQLIHEIPDHVPEKGTVVFFQEMMNNPTNYFIYLKIAEVANKFFNPKTATRYITEKLSHLSLEDLEGLKNQSAECQDLSKNEEKSIDEEQETVEFLNDILNRMILDKKGQ